MPRAEPWTIADLLDFEYLLAAAKEGDPPDLAGDPPHRIDPERLNDRRFVFKRWLEAHRQRSTGALPGQPYRTSSQTLLTMVILLGTGIGIGVTAGLLHYRGEEPVNVAWFFATIIGVQWALLLAAGVLWLARHSTGLMDDFRPMRALLEAALWALSTGLRRLPGEKRDRIRAVLARMGQRSETYGSLATWPLLIVTQLFGVCFNLGVLATLLLHVALSDVAFGWQSTLRTSPEEAFRLVSAIARPWAFAPNAHPSLDQVVASRFAYSEGIRPLSQAAMAAWWPFLCYSVLTYGLLVRGLLLGWAVVKLRRALGAITFGHHGCHALHRRLTGPVIHAEAGRAALKIPDAPTVPPARLAGACLALVAQDMAVEALVLKSTLRRSFGWTLAATLPVQIDHPSGNTAALTRLSAPGFAGVAVVLPARRAPIKAIALFLQKVAGAVDGKAEVVLLLTGRKEGEGFAAVSGEEFQHWQNFIAIHALAVSLERWPAE